MSLPKKACQLLLWVFLTVPIETHDAMANFDTVHPMNPYKYRYSNYKEELGQKKGMGCISIRPKTSEIVQRVYAVLPYFDKDHANAAFLHRMRGTINSMTDGSDVLDREVAYFAAVLTPIVFLQNYKDTWCLLERFHRAIRFYQVSHPTEKRSALKLLQNLRSVIIKIGDFMHDLHGPSMMHSDRVEDEEVQDTTHANRKNIRFIKELIKNLG